MSFWDSQIEKLTGDGSTTAAAIYGTDGTIRATSAGVSVQLSEVQNLVKALGDGLDHSSKEIFLEGIQYDIVNQEKNFFLVQESSQGAVCYLSKDTVWIGFYEVGSADNCTNAIKSLADSIPAGSH
ncbi:hypothetical protein BGZ76_000740 [Entomortierella beljakovae]|nr:hypothetical protein BGZ76_000740 [Entomortierella beljakovae]